MRIESKIFATVKIMRMILKDKTVMRQKHISKNVNKNPNNMNDKEIWRLIKM